MQSNIHILPLPIAVYSSRDNWQICCQGAIKTDPGFHYEQLESGDLQLGHHEYTPAAARAYRDQVESRLCAVPRVNAELLVKLPPLAHTMSNVQLDINGWPVTVYPN